MFPHPRIAAGIAPLSRFLVDVGYASHTFVSVEDMNETGVISFKKFHESLARLGVQLSSKEFHLLTVMFDANGFEILYQSLLQSLAQLPQWQQLAKALERCHRFGISSLREKLLTFVNSDDGQLTQEELLRVLMQQSSQNTLPRVAYLSRLLMECGGIRDESSLPKDAFWTQLEQAIERQVTQWERLRLQHLFDVSRDGQIAYKLFLKVMSQWRSPVNSITSVPLRGIERTEQRPAAKPEKHPRIQESTKSDDKPPCACDAILRSLYNQMSSIDFDSQVDIVGEYLRLKDRKHTGSIRMKQLKKVFDQIGLSLSAGAFTSLQIFFPGIASPSAEEEQGELVAYGKLLLALEALHEESGDKQ